VRKACKVLFRNPEVWRPFESLGSKWEDNIKIDLEEIESKNVDWTHLAEGRN
jgi:hypothetical protein